MELKLFQYWMLMDAIKFKSSIMENALRLLTIALSIRLLDFANTAILDTKSLFSEIVHLPTTILPVSLATGLIKFKTNVLQLTSVAIGITPTTDHAITVQKATS